MDVVAWELTLLDILVKMNMYSKKCHFNKD